jgi:integrase
LAGKIRYLLFRDGRYYARRVVPVELRPLVGGNELRQPLGPDRQAATRLLPAALVQINAKIESARRALVQRSGPAAAKYNQRALTDEELARVHYAERLAFDELARNTSPAWASVSIDDLFVSELRGVLAGRLGDEEIQRLLGDALARFRSLGLLAAERGTSDWRRAARRLAEAELEALERVYERDEGMLPGRQSHPAHLLPTRDAFEEAVPLAPVSLRDLLESHLCSLERSGRGRAARKSWTRVFEDLLGFLRKQRKLHGPTVDEADDANRLTADELIAWRDNKLETLSAKTVKDVWLASIKSVLRHAVEDRKLTENPASNLRVRISPAPRLRDKGYSDAEARNILAACRRYVPPSRENPANRESAHLTAAKRWAPWLCAFTGARIGEILQLRKADIQVQNGITFLHITPEAGTVKNRAFRDVPLHAQLVELGFLTFVESSADGPLFYSPRADPEKLPAQAVAGRLSLWLRVSNLVPDGVPPNHGWRHRFKTLSRDLGHDPHIIDAIQGHKGQTASDGYGDVTLRAKKAAIDKFEAYFLEAD